MLITDTEYESLWAEVREYIDTICIERDKIMPSKKVGEYYSWMFYLRRATYNHKIMKQIAKMFIYKFERIDPEFNFQLSGLETAATPIVCSIPIIAAEYGLDLNAFMVRKNRKEYGLQNLFEGIVNNKPAVMIDDLSNSTLSLGKCFVKLLSEGVNVADKAFVIVSKTNHIDKTHADKFLPAPGLEIISLFNLNDFDLDYD